MDVCGSGPWILISCPKLLRDQNHWLEIIFFVSPGPLTKKRERKSLTDFTSCSKVHATCQDGSWIIFLDLRELDWVYITWEIWENHCTWSQAQTKGTKDNGSSSLVSLSLSGSSKKKTKIMGVASVNKETAWSCTTHESPTCWQSNVNCNKMCYAEVFVLNCLRFPS